MMTEEERKERLREQYRDYRRVRRDVLREQQRRSYHKHKQKRNEASKEWRLRNPDYERQHYQKNKEHIRKRTRQWNWRRLGLDVARMEQEFQARKAWYAKNPSGTSRQKYYDFHLNEERSRNKVYYHQNRERESERCRLRNAQIRVAVDFVRQLGFEVENTSAARTAALAYVRQAGLLPPTPAGP